MVFARPYTHQRHYMSRTHFIILSLLHHWRGNFAVLLGAAVGTAVLTGALLVGDSLRGTLRDQALHQLNGTEFALTGPRFIHQGIADELPGKVTPAILMQGSVLAGLPGQESRAGKVSIIGVDTRFPIANPLLDGAEAVAILSAPLARTLKISKGDQIRVDLKKASAIPQASAFGRRDLKSATSTLILTVTEILPETDPANSFSLSVAPALPNIVFIPLHTLQLQIDQPGRVNALLASGQSLQSLQSALQSHLTLADFDLNVKYADRPYINVTSRRLLLEPAIVQACESSAEMLHFVPSRSLVYLANTITDEGNFALIPYSVIAGIEPNAPDRLNPLPPDIRDLKTGEIVLVDWVQECAKLGKKKAQLEFKQGDNIALKYYAPETEKSLDPDKTETANFTLKGLIPIEGAAADRDFTPDFPGLTDKASLRDWDPPFAINFDLIKPLDEAYWNAHRTTPKGYIRLEDAQRLWGSRYGNVTSVRIALAGGKQEELLIAYRTELLQTLNPSALGLKFQPVREQLLDAGNGSTDFGMLFLGFSFFLILAALMLIGLLVRLNLDRRAREIGLLRATGYPLRTVRRFLLLENTLLSTVGGIVGLAAAAGYTKLLLDLLARLWPQEGLGASLHLHITLMSLAIGFVSAVLASMIAAWWALRVISRVEPSALLKGETAPPASMPGVMKLRIPIAIVIMGILGTIGLTLYAPYLPPGEPQAGSFFGAGVMLLAAGLALLWLGLKWSPRTLSMGHGISGLARFGSRNARRNPTRSLLTAGLLAAAAFLLVAVESFRREPAKDFLDHFGGSGGYALLAEADPPFPIDPRDPHTMDQIEERLQQIYQQQGLDAIAAKKRASHNTDTLRGAKFMPFRTHAGDDASCLNLYQAIHPRILGATKELINDGGFEFQQSLAKSQDEKANPWLLLRNKPAGGAIPVFVEANTAMWMLKLELGDSFEVPDGEGNPVQLQIVGLLQDSVFQSEVLMASDSFRRLFPRDEGFGYFLIQTSREQMDAVRRILGVDLNWMVVPTEEKVATYLAVQNTYLSTFQLLGGFGLLLGVLGLGVVLLRTVWERRGELALLRAMGYRVRSLFVLVLAENVALLLLGLGLGVVAAIAAVLPHMTQGNSIPVGKLAVLLGIVLAAGLAVVAGTVLATLRAPLIPALRRE